MKQLLVACLVLLTACSSEPEPKLTEFSGIRMTILYRVLVAGEIDAELIQQKIDEVFVDIDEHYNDWNPDSEISQLQQADAGRWHALSPGLAAHLGDINTLVSETGGLFDPSVGQRAHQWKQALQQGRLPSEEELEQVPFGWQHIELRDEAIRWNVPGLGLDLGGIAKGLAIDRISEALTAAGYPDSYVEWGGELRVHGQHPAGRPWQIEVRALDGEDSQLLALSDAAVATSGDYLQSWQIDGKTYSHILDPLTGRPLILAPGQIASVTVIADSAVRADALATAAMLHATLAEAQAWSDTISGAAFYFQERP